MVVKSQKNGQGDGMDDNQPLLESEDELEREDLPGSRDRSVTAPRRAQPTEYNG